MAKRSTAGRAVPARLSPTRRVVPYERIKQAIMSGDLEPGAPLVELALAEWCEVSRTPVREALLRLEQDGLVVRGDQGLSVRESSPEEILDIYDTRIVLEARAAAVAAERRTSHDLMAMRRLTDKFSHCDAEEASALAETNREFHRSVWRASHNDSLVDLLERLNLLLGRYPATTLAFPGRWKTASVEHNKLLLAIEARDEEEAAAVATRHFSAARDIRLRLWEGE